MYVLYTFEIYIVDNIDLTIEEPTKTLGIINQNKSELLKNGEEVILRYFLSSDSVYVSQVSQKFDDLMHTMNYAPDKCKFISCNII